jgi:hypothetical protein
MTSKPCSKISSHHRVNISLEKAICCLEYISVPRISICERVVTLLDGSNCMKERVTVAGTLDDFIALLTHYSVYVSTKLLKYAALFKEIVFIPEMYMVGSFWSILSKYLASSPG